MNPSGPRPSPTPAAAPVGPELLAAVAAAPGACLVADDAGTIRALNDAAAPLFGAPRAALLGAALASFAAPGEDPPPAARLAAVGAEAEEFTGRVRGRDGAERTVEFRAVRAGAFRLAHLADADSRRRSGDRLRQLSRAVEQSPALIVITDTSGRIEYVNPRFEAVTGYATAEVLGRNPRLLKSGEGPAALYRELWDTVTRGGVWHGEFHNRRKDGTLYWEQAAIAPVRDEAGRLTHFVAVKEDITARKEAEEAARLAHLRLEHGNRQLEQAVAHARELAFKAEAANRAKTAFLATMSHELRTPLNVINGLAATLGEQAPDSEQARAVQLILASGQNLLGLIEKLLDFSGLQAGETQLDQRGFRPLETLAAAVLQARDLVGRRPVRLSWRLDPRLPAEAIGDPRRVGFVIAQLLSNAAKFTTCGRIHLAVSVAPAPRGHWVLCATVLDTGPGIPADDLRRLFQPFVRGTAATARHDAGTGLGLSIARAFAQLMGGTITVRSRPGAGSAFRCTLVLREAGTDSAIAGAAPAGPAGRRLLVVSDDAPTRRFVADLAAPWRWTVVTAPNHARAAARLHAGETFEAVLLDADLASAGPLATRCPLVWLHRGAEPPVLPAGSRALRWPCALPELAAALVAPAPAPAAPPARPATASTVRTVTGRPRLGDQLPLRVLVADDMSTNRETLARMLQHLGYAASLAENGREVLELVAAEPFDLLFLDVQMPEMDGLTAAAELVRRFPDRATRPRMVALTANVLPGTREACLDAGMDDYLSKPVVPQQIRDCITHLFAPAPAAPAVVAPPEPADPLVDLPHLAAVLSGMPTDDLRGMLADLHTTAAADYEQQRPRLVEACARRDAAAVHGIAHGLKGCFAMLGWARLAHRCSEAQTQAKQQRFTGWTTFPDELHALYEQSEAALRPHLEHGLPPELIEAALAADGGGAR